MPFIAATNLTIWNMSDKTDITRFLWSLKTQADERQRQEKTAQFLKTQGTVDIMLRNGGEFVKIHTERDCKIRASA